MNVNLMSGFHGSIQIKDREDVVLYQKDCFSKVEVERFIQQYGKSKNK